METTGSIACVGLDPRPDMLPPVLVTEALATHGPGAAGVANAFATFNRGIIDVIAGQCAAIKPQAACYEAYGSAGWAALEATIAYAAAAGIPVVLDAKRGDIGSTATHYGQMAFGGAPGLDGVGVAGIGATWVTANPYLGFDGVGPMMDDANAGIFVLVKTSNPTSADLQDVDVRTGGTVAEQAADCVHEWGAGSVGTSGLSRVGAVVGATYPDHARDLRRHMPNTLFLVPGYGAQGGTGADALAGDRRDGYGVLVSSSRGITGAWQAGRGGDWQTAAATALAEMNADLNASR